MLSNDPGSIFRAESDFGSRQADSPTTDGRDAVGEKQETNTMFTSYPHVEFEGRRPSMQRKSCDNPQLLRFIDGLSMHYGGAIRVPVKS